MLNNKKNKINYCYGFGFEPEDIPKKEYYASAIVLTKAKTQKRLSHLVSQKLDHTNAFDIAEIKGPYLGQLNLITVSSFIGPNGRLFGYEIAQNENIYETKITEVEGINVYSAEPLIESSKQLFGTINEKHFPLIPGAHTPCASKSIAKEGPCYLYGGIGIGIASDRELNANILMEDVAYSKEIDPLVAEFEESRMQKQVAKSVVEISKNQRIKLDKIFVSTTRICVKKHEVGCVLSAVPYVTLPKAAITKSFNTLENISLSEWIDKTQDKFVCNL